MSERLGEPGHIYDAERFTDYYVLDADQVTAAPTYRGEGQCFG